MNRHIRPFTLEDGATAGRGLSCDVSGVALAGVPLLTKGRDGFQPRPARELDLLLRAAYGARLDTGHLARGLAVAADALNVGDLERAMIGALHLRLPPPDEDAAARLAKVDDLIAKYNYNPDEPRDWHGRWTSTGGDAPSPNAEAAPHATSVPALDSEGASDGELTPAAYNGRYHDKFLKEYAEYLRSKGQFVLTEVRLRMADGSAGARLDLLVRDSTTGFIYGIEIKTGDDPGFTPGQITVYAHAIMGASVMARDAKVAQVGLLPNVPLPPIPIYLVWRRNSQTNPVVRSLDPLKMARRYRGEHQ